MSTVCSLLHSCYKNFLWHEYISPFPNPYARIFTTYRKHKFWLKNPHKFKNINDKLQGLFVNNVCSFPPTLVPSPNDLELEFFELFCVIPVSPNDVSPIPNKNCLSIFAKTSYICLTKKLETLNFNVIVRKRFSVTQTSLLRIGKNQRQQYTVNLSISYSRFKALILPHLPSSYLYEG